MIENGLLGSFDGAWSVLPTIVKVNKKWHICKEKEADVVCTARIGTLVSGSKCITTAKNETKTARVEIRL